MKMFGAVVRALRAAQGSTREQLGVYVGYSASQVAMVERGERMPSARFVAKSAEFLQQRVAIEAAAEHLERSPHPSWFGEYLDLEAEAVSVWSYDAHVIKGLVQTEGYARAVLGEYCPMLDDEEVESRVQARLARQKLLTRVPAVSLALVIEEWVLRRPVGGPVVAKGQLERLLELSAMRNVSIQVMPTRYEGHAGFDGPFTLLETKERQWVAYVEGQSFGFVIDDREEVGNFQQRYGMIRTQALTPGDSVKLIEQMAGEL
ncbi:helix-turn-helix domain-containing protein [Streptomyces xylophagus]|uniref:helix-turn-helix domain-containing protein n=1 Tax=Streptomyces xylophagus TaxID=285514 RepID=UPI0005B828CE|nr:helix-turn-helix transcriptional regulator [Streptomyces xylophagus]